MGLKFTFIPFLFLLFITSSCDKEPYQLECKIDGSWKLVDASSQYGTAVSPILTSYKDGIFIFHRERSDMSGKAEYKDASVLMEGTWELKAIGGHYNDDGEWVDSGKREMTLYLTNNARTKILDWKFPQLSFVTSTRFVGVLAVNGYEYHYDFRK